MSYRHPGAPSPCETEARRKRANKVLATQLNAANLAHNSPSSGEVTPTSPNTLTHFQAALPTSNTTISNDLNCNDTSSLTAAQLNSAYQMFMPNQFHLAAAAANAAQQQQNQANDIQPPSGNTATIPPTKDFNNTLSSTTTSLMTATQNSPSNETLKSNNSPVPNTTTSTPTNNPNDLTNSVNNNSVEARISPNLNP